MTSDAGNRRFRCTLAWLCLMLAASPAVAPAQIATDVWTVDNGLPQNSVYDIRQTRDGYL